MNLYNFYSYVLKFRKFKPWAWKNTCKNILLNSCKVIKNPPTKPEAQ